MQYADEVGLPAVHKKILEFRAVHGANWEPTPLLARLAESGRTFSDWDTERSNARAAADKTYQGHG